MTLRAWGRRLTQAGVLVVIGSLLFLLGVGVAAKDMPPGDWLAGVCEALVETPLYLPPLIGVALMLLGGLLASNRKRPSLEGDKALRARRAQRLRAIGLLLIGLTLTFDAMLVLGFADDRRPSNLVIQFFRAPVTTVLGIFLIVGFGLVIVARRHR